ncbi:MAG: VWA domain-containing protein [Lachnospiraceae bacterium]|nr:VWA domain-containing protein [Lachnospiraceae bacterium]
MSKNKTFPIVGILIATAVIFGGLYITRNLGKSTKDVTQESAASKLNKMYEKVSPETAVPKKSAVEFTDSENDGSELPPITDDSISVKASTRLYAEIASSPEKAGSGADAYLTDMAKQFNSAGHEVNGEKVSVQLRNLTSGLVVDYIRTGRYVPDAFTPSNMMWVDMLKSYGQEVEAVDDSVVGNTACIVLENKKYKEFVDKYGGVDLKSVVEATESGEFIMGYTNPFVSSTGLNFLVSTLQRYDNDNPLSSTAAEGFAKFQNNVPLVAYNTMQMREAASRGTLDGFVLEMQTYNNDASLKRNYTATPFGYRHDNPLVMMLPAEPDKYEIVKLFKEFCETEEAKKTAAEYGFNDRDDYSYEQKDLDGSTLIEARRLYKEEKDAGKTVVGVFVCDESGSMDGTPIAGVKESLINSIQYISPDNYIGLVSYNSDVTIQVPLNKFDLTQQAYFKGGVEGLSAAGGTATYDGVIVALKMIEDKLPEVPDAKPIIFVLSDGDTNSGYSYKEIEDVVSGLKVPVYTINYNYEGSEALSRLSNINEAASINAGTDDVVYQLKNLLNASM